VESKSEGIFRWSRSRKEFLGGVGVGTIFRWIQGRVQKEFLGRVGVGKKRTDSNSDVSLKP
jgi:hypothetical protein